MNNCSQEFADKFPYVVREYAKENKIPVSATIELTPFCNFSCVMCYVRLTAEQAKLQGEMLTKEQILTVAQQAKEMGIINDSQLKMLNDFYTNPDETMRNFLIAHPEFLENALASDEKTAARAKLCIDSNLYNL